MCQLSTYFVNIATMIDQCYIPRNVLDSLLNVGLQGLLFGDDDFQFRKVGGLHYERSNYCHRQYLLAFILCELILLSTLTYLKYLRDQDLTQYHHIQITNIYQMFLFFAHCIYLC